MQEFAPERFRDARRAKIQRLVQSWAPRNRKIALAGIRAPDGSHSPLLEVGADALRHRWAKAHIAPMEPLTRSPPSLLRSSSPSTLQSNGSSHGNVFTA
eukprot:5513480-Pyramimonas_sp.AAC.1